VFLSTQERKQVQTRWQNGNELGVQYLEGGE
jgi:hypothetical protein